MIAVLLLLLPLVAASLNIFQARNAGLDHLFHSLEDRFNTMDELSAMQAMAWCLRHNKFDLLSKTVVRHHWLDFEFPDELFLNALLRFYSPLVREALGKLIETRWNGAFDTDAKSGLVKILWESMDLVETVETKGTILSLPANIMAMITDQIGPEDALSLLVTCWTLRDALAPSLRQQFFQSNEPLRYTLSLAKVYTKYLTTDHGQQVDYETLLIKNYQAVLFWGYLVKNEPFNSQSWRQFYKCHGSSATDSLSGWLEDCGRTIKPDLLAAVLAGSVTVSWKDFEAAMAGPMDTACLVQIISAIPQASMPSADHLALARHAESGAGMLVTLIKSRLDSCTNIYSVGSLELLVQMTSSLAALRTVLEKLPINRLLNPTHRTISYILGYSEACLKLFIRKFPSTKLAGDQWCSAVNSGFTTELLANLLLLVPSTHDVLSIRTFDALTRWTISADAYLILVSRAGFCFFQRHIIKAMMDGVAEQTVRLMLLKSRPTLDTKDMVMTINYAREKGYSEDMIELIKAVYE